jgi:histidyl-tRNA synthetase
MHQTEIALPFKRYQIQPVWRADRPQRGRYREFYQCDADVVGTDSLLNEAEFICIYDEVLSNLGLQDFTIKINNRKILTGIAEILGKPDLIIDLTVAIDKLDKIGFDGITTELLSKGFTLEDITTLKPIILLSGNNEIKLQSLKQILASSAAGLQGIEEIFTILNYLTSFELQNAKVELDLTLARGLNYYTGCIFEVKTNQAIMGSIGGGGRYDNLTGMFGLHGLTGVGISFGADRIYDVLEELNLFKPSIEQTTQFLICVLGKDEEIYSLSLLNRLRKQNIAAELYPFGAKIKKQMQYANDKNIPFTVIVGSNEVQTGKLTFKNMQTGEQKALTIDEILLEI